MNARRSAITGVLLVLAIAVAGYWWYSPILVLHRMQDAAARGDAEAINEHVDYAALRESFRRQFSESLSSRIGQPADNPLSALGNMIGMAIGGQMIDALVRPEAISAAMATGRMKPQQSASAAAPDEPRDKVEWATERKGVDEMTAYPHDAGQPVDPKAPAFVFVRHGFADWKLSEVRLGS